MGDKDKYAFQREQWITHLRTRPPNSEGMALFEAVEAGDLKFTKYLLEEKGVDVNSRRSDNFSREDTVLHVAAGNAKDFALIQILLDAGADVNCRDGLGRTPLYHAAGWSTPEVVQGLLDAGAKMSLSGCVYPPPFYQAARYNENPDVLKVFLDAGAYVNDRIGFYEETALHKAISFNKNPEVLKVLLERGADVHARDKDGRTPLHSASLGKNLGFLKVLLEAGAGADVKVKDREGKTPLHTAAAHSSPDFVQALLDAGADMEAQDQEGNTPLLSAARDPESLAECIEALLDAGADPEAQGKDGRTAWEWAKMLRRTEDLVCRMRGDLPVHASQGMSP